MKRLIYLLLCSGVLLVVVESNSTPVPELKKHELAKVQPVDGFAVSNVDKSFLDDSCVPMIAQAYPLKHVSSISSLAVGFTPPFDSKVRGPTGHV